MEVKHKFFNGSIWTNFIKAEADRAAAAEQAMLIFLVCKNSKRIKTQLLV
jgi:hypothetical protein